MIGVSQDFEPSGSRNHGEHAEPEPAGPVPAGGDPAARGLPDFAAATRSLGSLNREAGRLARLSLANRSLANRGLSHQGPNDRGRADRDRATSAAFPAADTRAEPAAGTAAAAADPLRPARGLVIGLMLAVPFWLLVLGAVLRR